MGLAFNVLILASLFANGIHSIGKRLDDWKGRKNEGKNEHH